MTSDDLFGSDDRHDGSPTTQGISIDGIQQGLRDGLEQIFRFLLISLILSKSNAYQILLPQALAHTVQLLATRTRHNKVLHNEHSSQKQEKDLGKVDTTNQIRTRDKRCTILFQPSNDRFSIIRSESFLIKSRGDHMRKGLGCQLPFFTQRVDIRLESQLFGSTWLDRHGVEGRTESRHPWQDQRGRT